MMRGEEKQSIYVCRLSGNIALLKTQRVIYMEPRERVQTAVDIALSYVKSLSYVCNDKS